MEHDDQRGEDQRGAVSEATRSAEGEEAHSAHDADRPASPEEESAVDDERVDEEVREHYEDMLARGTKQKGEGRIP